MNKTDCEFCNRNSQFTKSNIKVYQHWSVELHHSQYYLGRCAVILNRHAEDLTQIDEKERRELFAILQQIRSALTAAFGADMINYASLGNIVPHVHMHVIPRYKKQVEFEGTQFNDENWGKNYAPYNREFHVPEASYAAIKNAILSNLEENKV